MTRNRLVVLLPILTLGPLAACQREPATAAGNVVDAPSLQATADPAPKPAEDYSIDRDDEALSFHYGWPAEAAAIPALEARFRADMDKAYAEAHRNALTDQAEARKDGRTAHAHEYSMQWNTAGQSTGLLSLFGEIAFYTGGAHPNHGTKGLLWDREADRSIEPGDLFEGTGALERLTLAAWCKALDAERARRRMGETSEIFSDCPPFTEIAIVPADTDSNGKLDSLRYFADPYVAGPYAEGDYEIVLPIDDRLLAAIKPAYRAGFERQPLQ